MNTCMCNNTLACRRNVFDNVRVDNLFLFLNNDHLKAIQCHFKGSYDRHDQNVHMMNNSFDHITSLLFSG